MEARLSCEGLGPLVISKANARDVGAGTTTPHDVPELTCGSYLYLKVKFSTSFKHKCPSPNE
jgi:hypothetical protein